MAQAATESIVPSCRVYLDGAELAPDVAAAFTRVEVDLDADLFGRCTLLFHDPQLKLINGTSFKPGAHVRVELGFEARRKQVFEGEVVALEPAFRRDLPPSLGVVCFEELHRLALAAMTRAFNDVDDKQIATAIAHEHGLSVEAPSGTAGHALQAGVTDAVFLRRLAQKSGNHLRLIGKKLLLGPPPDGEELTLTPASGVAKAKVKLRAAAQVSEISVHGWDPKQKREITGKARPEGVAGEGGKLHGGGAVLSFAGHEHAPLDPASAEAMARGRLRKIADRFATIELELRGDGAMVPGAKLTFENSGKPLDGTWRVEHAVHRFDRRGYWVKLRGVRVAKKKSKAPKPELITKLNDALERLPPPPDQHVIVVEVKGLGGTLLPGHAVRVLDPKTGAQVGPVLSTDDAGVLRATVPEKKTYRLELVDDAGAAPLPPVHADEPGVLSCQFVDAGGMPLGREKLTVKCGDDQFELVTDEQGQVRVVARFGELELTLQKQTFRAHALPAADVEQQHLFVVEEEKDLHLIAVTVTGLGDTPVANHPLRVVDPDSGDAVTDVLVTDDAGLVRAQVPEDKTYRIQLVDDEGGGAPPPMPADAQGVLACQFVDAGGAPLAAQKLTVKCGDATNELVTDAEGQARVVSLLAPLELTIAGKTFQAHGVPAADAETVQLFVVEEEQDLHVVAVTVTGLGDTTVANHPVRIVDPDSGEAVSDVLQTDADGLLRAQVPEGKPYRVQLVESADDAGDPVAPPVHHEEEPAVLLCRFTSADGAPLAGEPVSARPADGGGPASGHAVALTTDADGRLEIAVPLGAWELQIRGAKFHAHALPAADRQSGPDAGLYRFTVDAARGA